MKIGFKFQSLGKISNISTSDPQFFYVDSNTVDEFTTTQLTVLLKAKLEAKLDVAFIKVCLVCPRLEAGPVLSHIISNQIKYFFITYDKRVQYNGKIH